MSADAVYTQSGWFNRHAVIIPTPGIQVVDTEAGPLEQLLKLATVTVTTASSAGTIRIVGLDAAAAAQVAADLPSPLRGTPVTQPDPQTPGSTARAMASSVRLDDARGDARAGTPVSRRRRRPGQSFLGIPGIVPIVVGALAAVVAAVSIWLATTYQVTDQHVRVRSGVIRRKAATARRDRIRSVRPPRHR